jgi:hypothetical protein
VALLIAAASCFAVVWSGYRFSLEPAATAVQRPHEAIDALTGLHGRLHDLAYALVEFPVPAPEFARGLNELMAHNKAGHASYLMGEVKQHGHAAFFPAAIVVKTPIPFLVLAVVGAAWLLRRSCREDAPLALIPPLAAPCWPQYKGDLHLVLEARIVLRAALPRPGAQGPVLTVKGKISSAPACWTSMKSACASWTRTAWR